MTKQTIKRIIDFIAFVAVLASTVLVVIGKLIPSIKDILFLVAGGLCFLVCVLAGGYYAISRRNAIYISLLILAVVGFVVVLVVL